MLHLRIYCPADLTATVVAALEPDPAVSSLAVMRGASITPAGDVLLADVVREAANGVLDTLLDIGVHEDGSIHVEEVPNWVSRRGLAAEKKAPGSPADSVVWVEVAAQAYADSAFTWIFATMLTIATIIASIGVILDSQILLVGAMVVGPEFGTIAAMGLALVRRRPALLRQSIRTLVLGFALAIAIATMVACVWRALGWIDVDVVSDLNINTSFIYSPDKWSFMVALLAGAVGVLSITSARSSALVGVFISVTTVPAAGNAALGIALGAWDEVEGSLLQLVINITGMALAGCLTLAVQQLIWSRVARRPATLPPLPHHPHDR